MAAAIDLEISISPAPDRQYRLEFRLNIPGSDQVEAPVVSALKLPWETLERYRTSRDWIAYGGELSGALFGNRDTRSLYDVALRTATLQHAPLRVRCVFDQGAPELHGLVWEALLDPQRVEASSPAWLATKPDLLFSRLIAEGQPRQISLRQKFQLRALVFIANPRAPLGLRLPPIDVAEEEQRALAGLGGIVTTVVRSSPENPGAATLKHLLEHLDKTYDIFYLVCHGRFESSGDRPDTWLYLENEEGQLDRVRGKQLITEIQRLAVPPNLVLLMSCQTAGAGSAVRGGDGALASLGPRLIRAGVPAVVAMQGDLSMDTAAVFFPALLENLQGSGVIDAAVRAARNQVSGREDFYVPVLYHRLKSGRIWYGEAEAQGGDISSALMTHILEGDGAVILGSGLLEPYVGSQAEIARRLADKFGYPFSEKDRDDIALVCQYISATQSPTIMQTAYLRELALQVMRQHGGEALLQGKSIEQWSLPVAHAENRLEELLLSVWQRRREADPREPHTALARLGFKAYISTNPDTLMENALRIPNLAMARFPIVWECPKGGADFKLDSGLPKPERPLLAYLYGNLRRRESLVLTEDDYFEHLTTATLAGAQSIRELNNIFVGSALVFLGFRLHEWDFRIFFRRLKRLESWAQHKWFSHVAVQLDPSAAGGQASPRDVRKFMEKFIDSPEIEIFEGSVEQFVRGLSQGMAMRAASYGR